MSKLYVVGIGPGKFEGMTYEAVRALEDSDVIVGYTVYVDLVKAQFPEKTFLTTPMRREVERVELALREAVQGKTVAMVCSGDPGVYGMSGLCEELAVKYPGVEVATIPGVSAVLSGAAILGAPLMHEFAVVSLSDLMTPWAAIERRLRAAAAADFVICLYNPSSHKRKDYLQRACDVLLESASAETVCGGGTHRWTCSPPCSSAIPSPKSSAAGWSRPGGTTMTKALLFAGTTEGRKIAEGCRGKEIELTVSVATEYGETLIEPAENLHVVSGRKDADGIAATPPTPMPQR